jgi:ceramide glucosyltransferase
MLPDPLPWLHLLSSLALLAALAYHGLALTEVLLFTRWRRRQPPSSFTPPLTLLKPLPWLSPEIVENLRTFCRQDYPHYQVLIGRRADDPTPLTVADLAPLAPGCQVTIITCPLSLAPNPKIAQALALEPHIVHEIVVLSDADMRVAPDYLRRLVAPLQETLVGAVTSLYVTRTVPTWPAALEALMITTDFLPSVLVARRLGLPVALGAGLALRRSVLQAIGGLAAVGAYLADDYQIGVRAARAGWRIALAPTLSENRLPAMTLADLYHHQLRWYRTNRVCRPVGWFFSVITHLTTWTLLWLITGGRSPADGLLAGAVLAFRLITAWASNRLLGGPQPSWRYLWLVPLRDLCGTVLWALSFTGRRIRWAGREYVVSADGRLWPVAQKPGR